VVAVALIVVVVLIIVITSGSSPPAGYDISYPQCSSSYPSNPVFGIVGVNGGVASTANPCISDELQWARGTPGQRQPKQPSLSLYIDTGDPGTRVSTWPSGGTAPVYGACNRLLTNACSYLFGEQRSEHSFQLVAAVDPVAARTAPWWLDVELVESWAGTYALNVAALQGFVAGLHKAGATGPIGIYSTSAQWQEITGLNAQTTTTTFKARLLDWEAGVEGIAQARQNCSSGGFTGAAPMLAQYKIGSLDADLRCARAR
jgi:hypothetical protein